MWSYFVQNKSARYLFLFIFSYTHTCLPIMFGSACVFVCVLMYDSQHGKCSENGYLVITIFLNLINRWWAPSKFHPVKSPMLFFEKGEPVMPPVSPDLGLDMVLKHMVRVFFFLNIKNFNFELSHHCPTY